MYAARASALSKRYTSRALAQNLRYRGWAESRNTADQFGISFELRMAVDVSADGALALLDLGSEPSAMEIQRGGLDE